MFKRLFTLCGVVALMGLATTTAFAQEEDFLSAVSWQEGPDVAQLGSIATLQVPPGFVFADGDGARWFLEYTQNPPGGNEVGLLMPTDGSWFVVFTHDRTGYISDDENVDADAVLQLLRQGNDGANQERRRRGWEPMSLLGWQAKPYYDQLTNNLTWAILASSTYDGQRSDVVNHSVRLLGRRGLISAELVYSPDQTAAAMPAFDGVVSGLDFTNGERYADFRQGDRVAGYGLTALIAGGAGAVAAKTGLLAKMWKVVVAGLLALCMGVKGAIARLFGSRDTRLVRS